MSKILASIADAERLARFQALDGYHKSSNEISTTATAARAEHAEIVAALGRMRRIILDSEDVCNSPTCPCAQASAIRDIDSLLSRVGGVA